MAKTEFITAFPLRKKRVKSSYLACPEFIVISLTRLVLFSNCLWFAVCSCQILIDEKSLQFSLSIRTSFRELARFRWPFGNFISRSNIFTYFPIARKILQTFICVRTRWRFDNVRAAMSVRKHLSRHCQSTGIQFDWSEFPVSRGLFPAAGQGVRRCKAVNLSALIETTADEGNDRRRTTVGGLVFPMARDAEEIFSHFSPLLAFIFRFSHLLSQSQLCNVNIR